MAKRTKLPKGISLRGDSYRVRVNRNGVSRTRSFIDLDEAIAWHRKSLVEADGRVDDHKREIEKITATTSLKSVLQRYLTEISPKKKGYRKEISRLRMWMAQEWADLPMTSIRKSHIREWRDEMEAKDRAPTTISNGMNLLSAVFRVARSEWDIDVDNPVSGLIRPKKRRPRKAVPTDRLEALLLAAAEKSRAKWLGTFIIVAAWSAMRAGEICRLQWRDIHFDIHTIHVSDSKNSDPRDVTMLSAVEEALIRWKGDNQPSPDDWLFPSPTGDGPIKSDTPSTAFARLMDQVAAEYPDIQPITLHDLRHWGCSRLALVHRDAVHLMKTTGHRSYQSVAIYYDLDPAENAEEIRQKEAEMKRKKKRKTVAN